MRMAFRILLLYIGLSTCVLGSAMEHLGIIDEISIDSIKTHVRILGDDKMQGRATGAEGERRAGDYILAKLKAYNVAPAILNRSYIQNLPLHGSTPLASSEMTLFHGDKQQSLHLGDDYVLYHSGAQDYIPKPTPLVFVGYGISAPEFDYNDYQNIDVRDKIVVYVAGEPFSDDPSYFGGNQPTIYSYPESKERLALSHGARGSILVPDPYMKAAWDAKALQFSFEDVRLAYSATTQLGIMMNPMSAGALFANSPHSLEDIFKMKRRHTIRSFDLHAKLRFRGTFKERDFLSRNIISLVRGNDATLRDSYLLISAHYDHLGIGTPVHGDSIYNGVADNAMGVAALLEMARLFQQQPPKRSLLFLFFTGEEKGVLGSTYYVDNPVRPLYKTIANLNVDGLAIFDAFRSIVGYGAALSSLGDILNRTANALGLQTSTPPSQISRLESYARSDQIAFAKSGIPSILIMDGLNYEHLSYRDGLKKQIEWMQHIYHTPFDDLSQPINWDAVQQHCRVLVSFVQNCADDKNAPQWLPGSPYLNARLQSIAEKR